MQRLKFVGLTMSSHLTWTFSPQTWSKNKQTTRTVLPWEMEATCVVTTAHWNCYLLDGQAIFIPFWSSAYKGDKNHIIHYSHSRLFLFECSISSTSPPGTGAELLQNHHREHPHKHDHDAVLKLLKQPSGWPTPCGEDCILNELLQLEDVYTTLLRK